MSMEVFFDNEQKEIDFSGTIEELLKELNVMREEVVIKVNGKITPETESIGPEDKVEIIKVVFGG
jgi:thiamine biosynthesis protein ThiS